MSQFNTIFQYCKRHYIRGWLISRTGYPKNRNTKFVINSHGNHTPVTAYYTWVGMEVVASNTRPRDKQ